MPDIAPRRPLSRAVLRSEIGRSGLKVSGGLIYQDYDPKLRGARGVRLYEEMRRNESVIGVPFGVIRRQLRKARWRVEPDNDSAEAVAQAAWVATCLDDMERTWDDFLSEALTCLIFGWALHEIVYKVRRGPAADPPSKYDDGKIGWHKIPLRGQDSLDHWEIDDYGTIWGMWQRAEPSFELRFLPLEKCILFRTEVERNNPEGESLLRSCVRSYTQKKHFEDVLAIGVERDLTGMPVIYLPSDATEEDEAVASDIVAKTRVDDQAGLVLQRFGAEPHQNWEFQLIASPGQKSIDVEASIARCTHEMAMAFLAQFIRLGMSGAGSWALAKEQKALFKDALIAILDILADHINAYLIAPLVKVNGERLLCHAEHDPLPPSDLDGLAGFLAKLASAGFIRPDARIEQSLRGMVDMPNLTEDEIAERENEASMSEAPNAPAPVTAVEKFNPYHDERGRFTHAGGAAVGGAAPAGTNYVEHTDAPSPAWTKPWNAWNKGLTPQQRAAVKTYTSANDNSFYRINTGLRTGQLSERDRATIDNLNAALNKGSLSENTVLWRRASTGVFDNVKPGDMIHDKGFVSTSISKTYGMQDNGKTYKGKGVYEQNSPVVLKIHAPSGTKGAYVQSISSWKHEHEFLLPANQRFKVRKVEKLGDNPSMIIHVDLQ